MELVVYSMVCEYINRSFKISHLGFAQLLNLWYETLTSSLWLNSSTIQTPQICMLDFDQTFLKVTGSKLE